MDYRCRTLVDGLADVPLHDQVIRVSGGRVEAVTAAAAGAPRGSAVAPAEPGGEVLDLGPLTVLPGIVDCHDHLCVDLGDEQAQSEQPLIWLALKGAQTARLLLEAGITTLRYVCDPHKLDVYLRDAVNQGILAGPRMHVSGYSITTTAGHCWWDSRLADGPVEIRRAVREQVQAGVDLIKLMITGGLSTPNQSPTQSSMTDEEIVAAIDEAHRWGKKVAAHLHGGPAVRTAVEAGLDSIEHGVYLTEGDLELMAAKGTWLVVTYGVMAVGFDAPQVPAFMKENLLAADARYLKTIALAVKHGVRIAAGGDTLHGRPDLELRGLIEGGLPPMEAIKALTARGAELAGFDTGVLAPGRPADLIAVDGDPFTDPSALNRVKLVVKDGRVAVDHLRGLAQ